MSGCDLQCCVTPGSWQSCLNLTLDICKEGTRHYIQASLHGIRKDHCSGSQEPDSSLSVPPLGSSLLVCQMGMGQVGP